MEYPTAQQVAEALKARGAARHVIDAGAEGLLTRWRAFVSQVEAGYPFGLDDYRNDLDLRTLIAVAGLAGQAAPEDARFRELLTGEAEIWSSDVADAWWNRGYPGNAGPALMDDLRAEGLL